MPSPAQPNVSEPAPDRSATTTGSRKPRRTARRLLWIALTTIVGTYVAVCIVIYSIQERLIYYPSKTYAATPAGYGLPFEDLTLTTEDEVTIAAWYIPHAASKGTVLCCHGNAENLADMFQTFKSLHRLGYSVLGFDYRGYGRSTGAPSERGTYYDADAAWSYLTQTRHEQPAHIVIFGRSLGGAVAIDLAARHQPGALVVESTFTSLVDIGQREYPYLPIALLCKHRYESIRKVPAITCPKLFLHGVKDELIPLENAQRLFAAAAQPKEFVQTGGGHTDAGFEYNWELTQRLAAWLASVLPTEAP